MATTKDFTIKQYNGTDYDVLEPSSVSSQIHLSAAIVAKLNALGVTTTDDFDKLLDGLTVRVSSTPPSNPVKGTWWYQIVTGDNPGGSPTYLTFSSQQPFTLKATKGKTWDGTLEYSFDTNTWMTWDGSTLLQPPEGYHLYMRGAGNTKITGIGTVFKNAKWELTGTDIACTGSIENLLDYTVVQRREHPAMAEGCYSCMFYGCTGLTAAPELPATVLASNCYSYMFRGCERLTTAPSLPVTTLAEGCYSSMFIDCTGLTTAPNLPATVLAPSCYSGMFYNCTSLTTAPNLPATTLADNCYNGMFTDCTGLTTAPNLPVTTLAKNCYRYMFRRCTRLTTAPSLPATTLTEGCYDGMFDGCTGLTTVPNLPATVLAPSCYSYMFSGCANLKLSTTATDSYTIAYRIPSAGEGTSGQDSLTNMFIDTGGTFVGTPEINTTYYLDNSNSIV